jgi:4-amino-4-deoxy-L-arabinose transferase-like glycosyltransferase
MRNFSRQTWAQLILVYAIIFLFVWIGFHNASAFALASTILAACAMLFSVAFTVYTLRRAGKFRTRPKWWADFGTDKKYSSTKQTPKHL